jgi:hypothetical protein
MITRKVQRVVEGNLSWERRYLDESLKNDRTSRCRDEKEVHCGWKE